MKILNITRNRASTSDLPRGVFRVPDTGTYLQAVQDVDSGEWFDEEGKPCPRSVTRNYNPSKPPAERSLPSTMQEWIATSIGEFFPLTVDWQNFWVDLIDKATEYTLSKRFQSYSKSGISIPYEQLNDGDLPYWWIYATQHSLAMTDGHAAFYHGKLVPVSEGGFADYIIGVNLKKEDGTPNKPISKKSLDMSGNLFKKIGYEKGYTVVETLNAGYIDSSGKFITLPPPSVDEVWDKPWLIHWAVESTVMSTGNGKFAQAKFPPKPYGLPFPHMGIGNKGDKFGRNYVKPNRLTSIGNGELFSPYYPMPMS